ncbi:MAG: prepilin-type N-terminal cleavage/methylation domain-containing protein [Candidatus Omnitrophica bacterium]|nr:prepilin-type N-terminal cleavage/methylation domain-containing protein [Candidatus Omnitrophota bacterium]
MKKKGFTLLEVLVVIIIIGILAALALPQYMKTIKKARIAEAASNIGSLRGAEIRYYQENDKMVTGDDFGNLDIEDPNLVTNAYFHYTVSGTSPEDIKIIATGITTKITNKVEVTYNDEWNGKITDNLATLK